MSLDEEIPQLQFSGILVSPWGLCQPGKLVLHVAFGSILEVDFVDQRAIRFTPFRGFHQGATMSDSHNGKSVKTERRSFLERVAERFGLNASAKAVFSDP